MIHNILSNYAQFFNLEVLKNTLCSWNSWAIILTLVIIEGLLSADNALVLAMMVKHLPEKEQKKALTYGIWGAYIFRFIAIGLGAYLIKIWWVKLIGALYLLHMVYDHFFKKNQEDEFDEEKVKGKGLWATIFAVELMDIAFSIDSVTSALGVSNQVWVLFLGAVLGILMMRFVAKIFVALIEKVPELESSAYILIAIIGTRMVLELVHIEIPDVIFFLSLIIVFGGTFVLHKFKNNAEKA